MPEISQPGATGGDRTQLVTVAYRAFEDTPVTISFRYSPDRDVDPRTLCEQLFEQTNTYQGPLFDLMRPGLDATRDTGRHHTALSVGDRVTINGRTWECAPLSWEPVGQVWEHIPTPPSGRPDVPATPPTPDRRVGF